MEHPAQSLGSPLAVDTRESLKCRYLVAALAALFRRGERMGGPGQAEPDGLGDGVDASVHGVGPELPIVAPDPEAT